MRSGGSSERFSLTIGLPTERGVAMSVQRTRAARLGCVVFGLALAASELAWANGREFFAAPFGNVDLVYTGRVRNISGRFLQRAMLVIWSDELGLTFPSVT